MSNGFIVYNDIMTLPIICTLHNCSKKYFASGLCTKHYMRKRRGKEINEKTNRDKRPHYYDNGLYKIPLGLNGKDGFCLIDIDFAHLDKYNWKIANHGYAVAWVEGKKQLMHRLIMNPPLHKEVDHINHDILDNRKHNLRIVSRSMNNMNRKIQSNNKLGVKGVIKVGDLFYVNINKDGKRYSGGSGYPTLQLAAKRYNELAIELFGNYAYLNDVE